MKKKSCKFVNIKHNNKLDQSPNKKKNDIVNYSLL